MPISKPVLSVQPTSSRLRNKQLILRRAPVIPPLPYDAKDEIGVIINNTQDPERLGQMCYYRESNSTRFVTMYVVVSIEGVLEWKEVASGVTFIDRDTGNPWNPTSRL